ncbi:hypothetical protein QL285_076301 [Trifolium repens]|nr:hypothetical protein QL285_076301 [Trifolium repens]
MLSGDIYRNLIKRKRRNSRCSAALGCHCIIHKLASQTRNTEFNSTIRSWLLASRNRDILSPGLVFNYCITMEPRKFDPGHSGELLKHMDKQNEVLMEAYRSMLHELQKLQVEEEMLMRKLYEVMPVHGLTKKNEDNSNSSHNSAGAEQSNNEDNTDNEEQ